MSFVYEIITTDYFKGIFFKDPYISMTCVEHKIAAT